MKKNCWEIKNCGRHQGGEYVHNLGVCPASTDERLHGIHGGKNAGRACWVIAGTLCGGEIQGTFAKKFKNCEACDVYKSVKKEEFPEFKLSASLLAKISG